MKQFYQKLDNFLKNNPQSDDGLNVLEFAYDILGEVPEEVIKYISAKTGIWDVTLKNTLKFYPHFKSFKDHRHLVIVTCHGRNCRETNSELIEQLQEYMEHVGLEELRKRNPQIDKLKFDTEQCFSKCGKAPVIKVGDTFYYDMTLEKLKEILNI